MTDLLKSYPSLSRESVLAAMTQLVHKLDALASNPQAIANTPTHLLACELVLMTPAIN